MKNRKAKLKGVKTFNVNIRVSDELRDTVQYLKLLPGGITAFIEAELRKVVVDRELMDKLKNLKR